MNPSAPRAPVDSNPPPAPWIFNADHLAVVNQAATVAEDSVSSAYKLSKSEWLRGGRFDIVTAAGQSKGEQVEGPFAQILRYRGQPTGSSLESAAYDHYRICLQDAAILTAVAANPKLGLYPLVLYILVHELIHVIRFARFEQRFAASAAEIHTEEQRVHAQTYAVLRSQTDQVPGLTLVFDFFEQWRQILEHRESMSNAG